MKLEVFYPYNYRFVLKLPTKLILSHFNDVALRLQGQIGLVINKNLLKNSMALRNDNNIQYKVYLFLNDSRKIFKTFSTFYGHI